MKFPTNTRCLVMWGLLAFYLFFIVFYYFSKFSEGLTEDSTSEESTNKESNDVDSQEPSFIKKPTNTSTNVSE